MTQNQDGTTALHESESESLSHPVGHYLGIWLRRLLAGNPFYLASAGLLLYGINKLTTDPRLVGAEHSMLAFNFCALLIYEILLTLTTVALARRKIWYDALLLIGVANIFMIVPFSLVSRAAFLGPDLAWGMCLAGCLLAAGKFWAFQRYIPELRLPRRLLLFGGLLLIANAVAPLRFKAMADTPDQMNSWLANLWLWALPAFAALANLLPCSATHGVPPLGGKVLARTVTARISGALGISGVAPAEAGTPNLGPRWLPQGFYAAWIVVTAFHLGGIGYAGGFFEWKFSLLAPVGWVMAWTLCLRLRDFAPNARETFRRNLQFLPLLVPLLATDGDWLLPLLSLANMFCYGFQLYSGQRSRPIILQFFGAAAVFVCGLPLTTLHHVAPELGRGVWIICCLFLSFFWLIFLSRDPRLALLAGLSLPVAYLFLAQNLKLAPHYVVDFSFVFVLAHSVRWQDEIHRGTGVLRNIAGTLWLIHVSNWLSPPANSARLLIYGGAALLLLYYVIHAALTRSWKPRVLPCYAVAVLMMEPEIRLARAFMNASPGFAAILASFLLFAAGTFAAFTKSKRVKAHP